MSEARDLLLRLAAHDESSLRSVLHPAPEHAGDEALARPLDRRTRVLVRLAALLAVGASTTSLRWATELVTATGLDDDAVLGVLIAAAGAVGSARIVASAPRLALALGFDVELERWDAP